MEIKGLIFDIRRFTIHDGPGIRTTVFFKGCPLSCWWCHNPESQDLIAGLIHKNYFLSGKSFRRTEAVGKFMTAAEVMREIIKDRVFYDESNGGVTFSGGEPLLQESFLLELLKASKSQGFHTAVDTCGYASLNTLQQIAPWVDLFLYDIKLSDNTLHQKYTGVSNKQIHANLKYLFSKGYHVKLRFPVISGITDSRENMNGMKALIRSLNRSNPSKSQSDPEKRSPASPFTIDLIPYHDIARHKYFRFGKENKLGNLNIPTMDHLRKLAGEFESIGLQVNIGG